MFTSIVRTIKARPTRPTTANIKVRLESLDRGGQHAGERTDPFGVTFPASDTGLVVPDQPSWHTAELFEAEAAARRKVARDLTGRHLSVRDIGIIMRVSPQRVSQLVTLERELANTHSQLERYNHDWAWRRYSFVDQEERYWRDGRGQRSVAYG